MHISTVSRVVNNSRRVTVRPETRARILETADRLQYRPNALARALKTASTGALGLLVPSLHFYSEVIRGAYDRAWAQGRVVVLAEDSGKTADRAYAMLVREGRIDGLMVATASPGNPILDHVAQSSVPCVFVNRRHMGSGGNVYMREEDAGRLAARHLLELGHRRLGLVTGPLEIDTFSRRADGFCGTARAAGVEPAVHEEAFDERGGAAAMTALLERPEPPTAIFVASINQAVGGLAAARAHGVGVPRELSLIAYDDDPLAEFLEVALTVIRMPAAELGATAVDELMLVLDGYAPRNVEVATDPQLVSRASTAPPAAA